MKKLILLKLGIFTWIALSFFILHAAEVEKTDQKNGTISKRMMSIIKSHVIKT